MSTAAQAPIETPSKAAAAILSELDLNNAKKSSSEPTLLSKLEESKKTKMQHVSGSDDAYRGKFVGDLSITCDEDEPLLKETGHRFVLFPIKYHEVRLSLVCLMSNILTTISPFYA